MITQVRIAGFGGQGVILAASVIGKAATLYENLHATMTQSFGPESRGGASSAQLIVSDAPILYPYVTSPDILVVLSQEAATRFIPELHEGSLLLLEEDLVRLSDVRSGVRVHGVPATRLAEELGKKIVLNIVVVGFFGAVTRVVSRESLRRAVADSVPPHLQELNLRAFDKGYDYGLEKRPASGLDDEQPVLTGHGG
jgi:2-oxoglutarate ferredoxin oxidoreductase subunit gamma